MFFCKDIFIDIPKALFAKEILAIPETSNFLKRAFFRIFVWFLSSRLPLYASRFTNCPLIWFRLVRVRLRLM